MSYKDLSAIRWAKDVNYECLKNTCIFLNKWYSKLLIYKTLRRCEISKSVAKEIIRCCVD